MGGNYSPSMGEELRGLNSHNKEVWGKALFYVAQGFSPAKKNCFNKDLSRAEALRYSEPFRRLGQNENNC